MRRFVSKGAYLLTVAKRWFRDGIDKSEIDAAVRGSRTSLGRISSSWPFRRMSSCFLVFNFKHLHVAYSSSGIPLTRSSDSCEDTSVFATEGCAAKAWAASLRPVPRVFSCGLQYHNPRAPDLQISLF